MVTGTTPVTKLLEFESKTGEATVTVSVSGLDLSRSNHRKAFFSISFAVVAMFPERHDFRRIAIQGLPKNADKMYPQVCRLTLELCRLMGFELELAGGADVDTGQYEFPVTWQKNIRENV